MKKRAVSAVLASVWIVFLMAVIVSFTWLFVIPLIGEGPIAVEAASLEIVQEGYTAWDPINRLAEIQVKRGNDSAEIEGFDLIFELSEKTLNHSVRQEISLNSKNVYYFNFSEILGTLEEVKLSPVYKNGKKGEVVSILKISNFDNRDLNGTGKKYVKPGEPDDGSGPSDPDPTCSNDCISDGCVDGNARFECKEAGDGDSCLEKVKIDCGSGEVCNDGVCEAEAPVASCGDGECKGEETCLTCEKDCGGCSKIEVMRNSITQYGITWTFDKEYETGQFVNGDYWVVGPLKLLILVSPQAWINEMGQ